MEIEIVPYRTILSVIYSIAYVSMVVRTPLQRRRRRGKKNLPLVCGVDMHLSFTTIYPSATVSGHTAHSQKRKEP